MNLGMSLDRNKPQTIIFIALASLLTAIVYLYFILGPQIRALTAVLSRTGKVSAELKSAEALIAQKDSFRKNIEAFREKVDYYEKRLPAEQEIPSLLENLSAMAKRSNIKILGITPVQTPPNDQSSQKGKIYKEIPILIGAKSGYHELGSFLSSLEDADRFMKVVDIEISANKMTPKKHDVDLIVCTYVLLSEKEKR